MCLVAHPPDLIDKKSWLWLEQGQRFLVSDFNARFLSFLLIVLTPNNLRLASSCENNLGSLVCYPLSDDGIQTFFTPTPCTYTSLQLEMNFSRKVENQLCCTSMRDPI